MRRMLAAGLALGLGLLGACAPTPETDDPGGSFVSNLGSSNIDVDTPTLRAMKKQARVEPCPSSSAAPVEGGLPDLTLPCLGGGRDVRLAGLRGPMVVNFWASWCGPCRAEMPIFQAFHEKYGDRVPVLGIDFTDAQTELAMRLVQDTGVTYPLVADPDGVLQRAAPLPPLLGMPVTVVVDASGRPGPSPLTGEVDDLAELVDLVETNLGVQL